MPMRVGTSTTIVARWRLLKPAKVAGLVLNVHQRYTWALLRCVTDG